MKFHQPVGLSDRVEGVSDSSWFTVRGSRFAVAKGSETLRADTANREP
jgi:hypothetical protein